MARYDMHCNNCGHQYEAEAPMKDGPPKVCPDCGHELHQTYQKPAYHNHMSPMHPRVNRGRGY